MSNNKKCPMCGGMMPEKRIFKESEVVEICKNPDHFEKCRDEVLAAQREKRIMAGV